jgi:hypothetical protein
VERIAFLIEATGEWVRCLLNPEDLALTRQAGVHELRRNGRPVAGPSRREDPLVRTGGGRTTVDLRLLFDVSISRQRVPDDDVRRLTAPLLALTEPTGGHAAPVVRLIWGKHWNVPGLVLAMAERYEAFTESGVPRRSFVSLRFARLDESDTSATPPAPRSIAMDAVGPNPSRNTNANPGRVYLSASSGRIDQLAASHLGDTNAWRQLADANQLDDPADLSGLKSLRLP